MILTLTPERDARLQHWSKETRTPPETLINAVLDEALDDWEDCRDAVRICAEVDSGKMRTYSLEEVEEHLDALEG